MYKVFKNGKLEAKFFLRKKANEFIDNLKDSQFIEFGMIRDTFKVSL
jgi:hypothetical protein